jgi:hypothetical protein
MPRTARQAEPASYNDDLDDSEVVYAPSATPAPEPQVLQPATKNAKIKGTWIFHYGGEKYDFVDGYRYDLPLEVFEYLKRAGNIYDTM